jgi:hypothetical protein
MKLVFGFKERASEVVEAKPKKCFNRKLKIVSQQLIYKKGDFFSEIN